MNHRSANTAIRFRSFSKLWAAVPLAAVAIFGLTNPVSADIHLVQSGPTPLSDGLVSYTLRAVSNEGEIINTVANPRVVAGLGMMGLHQVWTPITDASTPTRQHQLNSSILWSDTWLAYDSYWFFSNATSLSIGADFSETNNHVGGVALPSAGFGPPGTGFGSMGTVGGNPGSKVYTAASGLAGTNVALAQLVMKAGQGVLASLGIYTNTGELTQFENVGIGCIFDCGPSIFGKNLGDVVRGQLITATMSVHPLDTFQPGTWRLDSFSGPDGNPVIGATVDADSGLFSWNSAGQPFGPYSAAIGRNLLGGSPVSGTLTFNLVVPEPASITLLALAISAAIGLLHRR